MPTEQNTRIIEDFIKEYPLFEYSFLDIDDVAFSDKVRFICETECENYNKSWSCASIGTLDECMSKCQQYPNAFVFSTITEITNWLDFDDCLKKRRDHEEISMDIYRDFQEHFESAFMLTSGCTACDTCAYPEPCRNPEKRVSPTESHGIIILKTAADAGMSYDFGADMVTYFSIIFYN